ncbi:MAG TPA: amino acid adenylation domain-containing protein, partial [Ktedonobacteraceae bacterium]|nr:amino acid adenylation domain-containing protein [Ktedonobacteraceae bacterium]
MQNTPPVRASLMGLTLQALEEESITAKFDLTLVAMDSERGLRCVLEYNTDLFQASTITRLLAHWQALLTGIVAQPEQPVSALPLLTQEERHQILHTWNDTGCSNLSEACLPQLLEAQVANAPDAIALRYGEEQVSYEQFNERANMLARMLVARGVGPERLVAVFAERNIAFVTAILAIWKAGGAYLPLDPQYPVSRLAQVLQQSECCLVITAEALQSTLLQALEASDGYRSAEHVGVVLLEAPLAQASSSTNLPTRCLPDQLAYVIYTSGSTGAPKGVMVEHRGMLNHIFAKAADVQLNHADIVAQNGPQSFDISVWQCFAALLSGGSVRIFSSETASDPYQLLEQIEEKGISILQLVPSMLRALLEQLTVPGKRPELRALRWLIPTGDALPAELCRQWLALYPNIPVLNTYGSTECSDDQCHYAITFPLEEENRFPIMPIGFPIPNMRAYVLDERLEPVPIGVIGELYIGGVGVGRGYLNASERTAQVFLPDPFGQQAGGRLYQTRDRARYLPDGNIEFLGRTDHLVKIRGYRIELGEIEAMLTQHPGVRECIVLTCEGEDTGTTWLVAYVVLTQSSAPSVEELRGYLEKKLPNYMLPTHFVRLEALPLTSNGKVDRRALPVPGPSSSGPGEDFLVARTPIEEMIAGIWSEVLRRKQVGVHENFFEVGGHSLLATKLVARIRTVLQVEVPLRALFEAPTVSKLAQRMEQMLRGGQEIEAPSLVPVPRGRELPLSFAQQRLWFLDQLEPNSTAYNIPNATRLSGKLNFHALEQSLQEVVRRHESLRTTFSTKEGQPVQVIEPCARCSLPVIELSALASEQHENEVLRLVQQEARRPFNLAHGPLLRATLLRHSENEHVVLLTMHHIVSDAWSYDIFLRELTILYNALAAGQPSPLSELSLQYADFASWQRQWLQGEVLEAQVAYWSEQLRGIPSLELPTDHPRPAVQTFRGAHQNLLLPALLSEELKRLSQREGVTLFMTLLGAFQVLLSRYSGQSDIAVGTPIANRTRAELEKLIGFFVNTLVLRCDLSDNPSFLDLLKRVREVCLEAYTHQDVPFEKLVEVLQPERDLSRSPLFQVTFQLHHAFEPSQAPRGLTVSGLSNESGTAKFDLSLAMTDSDQGLYCAVEYNTDLFEASTISRLLEHFRTLLASIVARPDDRLAELPVLSEGELQQLLCEWNETQKDYGAGLCLHTLFETQVERTPEAIALVFEDEHLTYRALNERANQVAHYLWRQGVAPEVLVGLCLERSPEMAIGLLGVLKAGGAYVPLDAAYPQERLAFMLADIQASTLLTQQRLAAELPEHSAQIICLDTNWEDIDQQSRVNPVSEVRSENAAYVIYTSGSTGRPKGVVVTHQAICNHMSWMQTNFPLGEMDRVLQKTAFSFDASIWEFFAPLQAGAQLIMAQPGGHRDISYLIEAVAHYGITVLQLVPSLLRVFLEHREITRCRSLKRVFCGGEELPVAVQQLFFTRLTADLYNLYGPTEASIDVTAWPCEPENTGQKIPIGRPIANTRIYLLDAHRQPVPIGVPGELHIGGIGLARGYLHCPDITAEKFFPDPFSSEPGARLYATGDLARYLPDGSIEYQERIDLQVKIRGFRIELGEIEAVLAQHPELLESVVMTIEGAAGDKRLAAYVVPRELPAPSSSELRRYLQEKLPDYMVPSALVVLEALPLMPNGKVDRRALSTLDMTGAEQGERMEMLSPVQELLVSLWGEVLGLKHIGIHENFFALGGHSILATQLISRVQSVLQVEISLRNLFEAPTVALLAERVEDALRAGQRTEMPPLVPTPREGELPLSFAQ